MEALAHPASAKRAHVCGSRSCRRLDRFPCRPAPSDQSCAGISATPDGGVSAGRGRKPCHWRRSAQRTNWSCRCACNRTSRSGPIIANRSSLNSSASQQAHASHADNLDPSFARFYSQLDFQQSLHSQDSRHIPSHPDSAFLAILNLLITSVRWVS